MVKIEVVLEQEKKRRKGRFAINAKPNPCTTPITHHDTTIPPLQNKNRKAGEMRMRGEMGKGGVTDWGER